MENINDLISKVRQSNDLKFQELKFKAEKWRAENNGKLAPWQEKVLRKDLEPVDNSNKLITALIAAETKRYRAEVENTRLCQDNDSLIMFLNDLGYNIKRQKENLKITATQSFRELVNTPAERVQAVKHISQVLAQTMINTLNPNIDGY